MRSLLDDRRKSYQLSSRIAPAVPSKNRLGVKFGTSFQVQDGVVQRISIVLELSKSNVAVIADNPTHALTAASLPFAAFVVMVDMREVRVSEKLTTDPACIALQHKVEFVVLQLEAVLIEPVLLKLLWILREPGFSIFLNMILTMVVLDLQVVTKLAMGPVPFGKGRVLCHFIYGLWLLALCTDHDFFFPPLIAFAAPLYTDGLVFVEGLFPLLWSCSA